ALYLSLAVLGPIAYLISKEGFVFDDPAATTSWIAGNELIVRLGHMAEFGIIAVEIVLTALLFFLMKPVSKEWSLVAALARFGMVGVQAVNLGLGVALVAAPAAAASLLPALAGGELAWVAIFGFHLVVLSVLITRSGFLPKWLGWLVGISALGYLAQGLGIMLVPDAAQFLETMVVATALPGELGLTFWLLIKGVDDDAWNRKAAH
ncbi:MAG: DUF4386 domain-containing protein, partial [Acidimicrobiia bacterium]|nr:DUF4386 domain-containing protein [Acidimicrobiia bacterium]